MNILMLTSEFPPVVGGVGSHVFELARALTALDARVTVVAPNIADDGRVLPFRVLRPRFMRGQPLYDWQLRRWLRRLLRVEHFDVVHVHGMRPARAVNGINLPRVFTNHTSGFLKRLQASALRRKLSLRRIQHFERILAPSEELVAATRTLGYHGPVDYIPNGVDAERFHPGDSLLRAQWQLPFDQPLIVMARRLVEKNGVRYFGEALALLGEEKFSVVIAGDGAEKENVLAPIRAAGLMDRVRVLGAIDNRQMPDIYRAADISVLPSLMEATSIAGLEAMACALPLVGTTVGGIPAIIDDGGNGLLVAPRDPAALAEKLRVLIRDAGLRQRMGEQARRRVENEFSWPVIARRTLDAYAQAMADKQASGRQGADRQKAGRKETDSKGPRA